jgi:hypothetical protein
VDLPYTTEKIYNTEHGGDPLYYPAVDWQDVLFKDYTFNQRYNMNISGGGTVARYYIAASYSKDNGIIKSDDRSKFNNNIDISRYVLRANVNVDVTKTTEAIVRLHGSFDDYSGPLNGGTDLYKKALNANPVYLQPWCAGRSQSVCKRHTLRKPHRQRPQSLRRSDEGLQVQRPLEHAGAVRSQAESGFRYQRTFPARAVQHQQVFEHHDEQPVQPVFRILSAEGKTGRPYMLQVLNATGDGRDTDYLVTVPGDRIITSSMYFEGAMQYNRDIADRHNLSALMVYTMREEKDGNADNLQASLPYRNLGLAGRLTYNYDSRYFIEGNFGYNGSERFAESERYGFFPSIGAGWIVTNRPPRRILGNKRLR